PPGPLRDVNFDHFDPRTFGLGSSDIFSAVLGGVPVLAAWPAPPLARPGLMRDWLELACDRDAGIRRAKGADDPRCSRARWFAGWQPRGCGACVHLLRA